MTLRKKSSTGRSSTRRTIVVALCSTFLFSLAFETAADEENSRLYRTRAEKREAGVKHQWTPWLSTTSIAEFEWVSDRFRSTVKDVTIEETVATLQLAAKIEPVEHLVGELVLEYDTELDKIEIDEAAVELVVEDWQLAAGKYYLPFGEYYSSFITDPIIQLGEVRAYASTLTYEFDQNTEMALFGYRSLYDDKADFGIALESSFKQVMLKVGYVNEFPTDEKLAVDDPKRKVPALTGHFLWSLDDFELSFEALGAVKSFSDEDSNRTRPLAWNLELTYIPDPQWDVTFRIEGSHDIDEVPKRQYGIAFNTLLHKNVTLGIEALHGRFSNDPNADDEEDFDHVNTLSAQLVVAF